MLTVFKEVSRGDRPWSGLSIPEFALGVLIPKEVAAFLSVSGKRIELFVECESVYSVHHRWFVPSTQSRASNWPCIINSVTFETEVITIYKLCLRIIAYFPLIAFLARSTYLMPHLPSMEAMAKPFPSAKHWIHVVGYFKGDAITPTGLKSLLVKILARFQ